MTLLPCILAEEIFKEIKINDWVEVFTGLLKWLMDVDKEFKNVCLSIYYAVNYILKKSNFKI